MTEGDQGVWSLVVLTIVWFASARLSVLKPISSKTGLQRVVLIASRAAFSESD